jgi:hypothetical protein
MHITSRRRAERDCNLRDRELKGVDGVTVFLVQGPGYALVQFLNRYLRLLGDMAHNGVHHFALVIPLFALDNVFRGHSTLGKIDITWKWCTR